MRFQSKLLLLFALLFAIALFARTVFISRFHKAQLAENTANMRKVTKVVHFATQRLASEKERDRNALNTFITDAVARHDDLREVSIINVNQEIIASSNPQKIGKHHTGFWHDMLAEGEFREGSNSDWYEMAIPIIKDNRIIGQVLASVLMNDFSESVDEFNNRNIAVTFILFIAVSLVSFIMIGRLMKPMRNLILAARRISLGDLNVSIPSKGRDEHAELANAFNSMAVKIGELRTYEERLRDMERHVILSETAAKLAHEIRNPLNVVNLTAGRLAHKYVPEDEKNRTEYLSLVKDMKTQVRFINEMVNEFLSVGKPLKLKKTLFPVTDLAAQTEMILKQQIISKNISFSMQIPRHLKLYADIEQMRLVLMNLVGNAIEVADMSGSVSLSGSEDGCSVVLSVHDKGPGIAPEDLEKIFEPYFTKRLGGTGLGLTLARRVILEHGGTIHAGNNDLGGAIFTIALPRPAEEQRDCVVS